MTKHLGQIIKEARESKGYSLSRLQHLTCLNSTTLKRLEKRGFTDSPRFEEICRVLELDYEKLKKFNKKPIIPSKNYFRFLRESNGLTVSEFSLKTGISQSYYSVIENNQKIKLQNKTLKKISDAYGIPLDKFIEDMFEFNFRNNSSKATSPTKEKIEDTSLSLRISKDRVLVGDNIQFEVELFSEEGQEFKIVGNTSKDKLKQLKNDIDSLLLELES